MPMENYSCEDILNWNTQARKDDRKKNHGTYNCPAVSQDVAALRESEQ